MACDCCAPPRGFLTLQVATVGASVSELPLMGVSDSPSFPPIVPQEGGGSGAQGIFVVYDSAWTTGLYKAFARHTSPHFSYSYSGGPHDPNLSYLKWASSDGKFVEWSIDWNTSNPVFSVGKPKLLSFANPPPPNPTPSDYTLEFDNQIGPTEIIADVENNIPDWPADSALQWLNLPLNDNFGDSPAFWANNGAALIYTPRWNADYGIFPPEQAQVRDAKYRLTHTPTPSCYLKVWLHYIDSYFTNTYGQALGNFGSDSAPILASIDAGEAATYEWFGADLGNGLCIDPNNTYFDGTHWHGLINSPIYPVDHLPSEETAFTPTVGGGSQRDGGIAWPYPVSKFRSIAVFKWSMIQGYEPDDPVFESTPLAPGSIFFPKQFPNGQFHRPDPDVRPNGTANGAPF